MSESKESLESKGSKSCALEKMERYQYGYVTNYDKENPVHYADNKKGAQYDAPPSPIFHPYDPALGGTAYPIRIKLDNVDLKSLPEAIQKKIVDQKGVEFYFVAQNLYLGDKEAYLMRPHYWLHKGAAVTSVSVLAVDARDQTELMNTSGDISSHPGEGGLICSPSNLALPINQPEKTRSVYSVVAGGGRTAVTLHWLLGKDDFEIVQQVIDQSKNTTLDRVLENTETYMAIVENEQATADLKAALTDAKHYCSHHLSDQSSHLDLQKAKDDYENEQIQQALALSLSSEKKMSEEEELKQAIELSKKTVSPPLSPSYNQSKNKASNKQPVQSQVTSSELIDRLPFRDFLSQNHVDELSALFDGLLSENVPITGDLVFDLLPSDIRESLLTAEDENVIKKSINDSLNFSTSPPIKHK